LEQNKWLTLGGARFSEGPRRRRVEQKSATARIPVDKFTALAPLNIIRTETVLSKLPVHNLSKKGGYPRRSGTP
jgi:hypothetical protein